VLGTFGKKAQADGNTSDRKPTGNGRPPRVCAETELKQETLLTLNDVIQEFACEPKRALVGSDKSRCVEDDPHRCGR